ncbi:hypothetical protein NHJ13051_008328 [Beauveria bassiana]
MDPVVSTDDAVVMVHERSYEYLKRNPGDYNGAINVFAYESCKINKFNSDDIIILNRHRSSLDDFREGLIEVYYGPPSDYLSD